MKCIVMCSLFEPKVVPGRFSKFTTIRAGPFLAWMKQEKAFIYFEPTAFGRLVTL